MKNTLHSVKHQTRSQVCNWLERNGMCAFLFFWILVMAPPKAHAQVSGYVFRDYNANGVVDTNDKGVLKAVVNAYSASGQLVGTDTVKTTDGAYLLPSITGALRIEFVNLSENFWDAPVGTQSRTSVQFITAPASNINLGLSQPRDFTNGQPSVVTVCYRAGVHTDFTNDPAIITFPYFQAGSSNRNAYTIDYDMPMNHDLTVPIAKVGSLWGMAYDRFAGKVYASAFMKRHAGFGPHGSGAIYQTDTVGVNASLIADLNAIFGPNTTGPDLHNMDLDHFRDYKVQGNLNTIDAVSKVSLGGLAISPDGMHLYVMNLFDRHLYIIPTQNPSAVNITKVPIPIPVGTSNPDDIRPFAVEQYLGVVYVGMVNSAQSTQNANDLKAYVYTFDPKSKTFNSKPFFETPLNYPRGKATPGSPNQIADWLPWTNGFKAIPPNVGDFNWQYPIYPQPLLVGIDFTDDGELVIGLRDRYGDQMGNIVRSNPDNDEYYSGVSTGDVLIAARKNDGWELETNGKVGNKISTSGPGNGPGGGEFFGDDYYVPFQNEISTGGVKILSGQSEVIVGTIDPIFVPNDVYLGGANSGGVRWFSTDDGSFKRGYRLFGPGHGGKAIKLDSLDLGKASSLGDVEVITTPGPLEIGNRIWRDRDGDGIQDADEPGIAGLNVELWKANTRIATEITDAKGEYYFSSNKHKELTRFSEVEIRLDTTQTLLTGLRLTKRNAATNDAIDSDATTQGAFAVILYSTQDAGMNNHTLDMGFQLCPVVSKMSSNTPLCAGQTLTLNLEGQHLGALSWAGPNDFSSTAQSPTLVQAQTSASGVYSATVVNEGCSLSNTVSVQVNTLTASISTNASVCAGANILLSTPAAATYNWTGPNGFVATQQTPTIATVTPINTGLYSLTVTGTNSCTASATVLVRVQTFEVNINTNSPVCRGNTLRLGASAAASYAWKGPYGFTSIAQSPTLNNVSALSSGVYSITATATSGCTASATASVVVNTFVTTINTNAPLCGGNSLQLTTNTASQYRWEGPASFTSAVQSPALSNITPSQAGVYSLTATATNSCTGSATTSVVVNTFKTSVVSNSPLCDGATLELATDAANVYRWEGPDGFVSNSQTPTVSPVTIEVAGVYSLTATATNSCTASATTSVIVNLSNARLFAQTATCKGNESYNDAAIFVTDFEEGAKCDWSLGQSYQGSRTFNNAIPIPDNGMIMSELKNPNQPTTYTIRIFMAPTCFVDRSVVLRSQICECPPAKCTPFRTRKIKNTSQ